MIAALLRMQLRYALAEIRDAAELARFELKVADPCLYGPPLDLQRSMTEIASNAFYFIKSGDLLLGTIAYCRRPDHIVYISNLAVDPRYRGQGIGRGAMRYVLNKLTNGTIIDLHVHPDNEGAFRLYKSLGFEVHSRHEDFFDDGEPRLLLRLEISSRAF